MNTPRYAASLSGKFLFLGILAIIPLGLVALIAW